MPEEEITALKKVVSAGVDARPFPYLTEGQRVSIIQEGLLFGILGILTKIKNRTHVVVSVDMITKSISIEVDHRDVVTEYTGTTIDVQSVGVHQFSKRLGA